MKFWIEKPEFSTVNQVILVITGVFAVIFIFSLLYVFALIARFDNTIFKSVKNAVMLSERDIFADSDPCNCNCAYDFYKRYLDFYDGWRIFSQCIYKFTAFYKSIPAI